MKKAKIMLMAITILGVIGGTLAYKSSNYFGAKYFCCTGSPKICIPNYTTIPQPVICTDGFLTLTSQRNAWPYLTTTATEFCTISTTVYFLLGE